MLWETGTCCHQFGAVGFVSDRIVLPAPCGVVKGAGRRLREPELMFSSAFGGMLAFCIIIGDTIPHVFAAVFPDLPNKPFLWMLTDRRAVIILFVLGISYPLSLYRDIAMVSLIPSGSLHSR